MPIPSLPLFVAAQQSAKDDPEKIAIIDVAKKESFTFTQLLEDTASLRKHFIETLGSTSSGDLNEQRVAYLCPAGYDYVATSWATWAAGGVCVPLCKKKSSMKASTSSSTNSNF
jgi:acyl-CoA synthetase (AMP-forming)/AMP-acid ligase II